MAENKKSFVLYCDILNTVEMLSDEQSGKLFKHILGYVNDLNPELDDLILKVAFEPIKLQLKRDLVRYEDKKIKWSVAGKISAENNKRQQTSTDDNDCQQMSTVTVTVNDTVTVTDTVINNKDDFLSKILFLFQKAYLEEYKTDYVLASKGKDRSLAGIIFNLFSEKYPGVVTEDVLSKIEVFFKKCCSIQDKWYRNNMSPSLIVSKFNEIKVLTETNGNVNPGLTYNEMIKRCNSSYSTDNFERKEIDGKVRYYEKSKMKL